MHIWKINRLIAIMLITVLLLAVGIPAMASSQSATPTAASVIVNGTNASFEAYHIKCA